MARFFALNILFILMLHTAQAQVADKTVLTLDSFIVQLKANHPIARQASLQVDKAVAELLAAKGSFDPTIGMEASRKTFNGKNYYNYFNPNVTVPLPVGNIKSGIENNGGEYLATEVTAGKTSYLGIEIPVVKGLLLDARRATLQQAKIYVNQSEQERLYMLNELLLDAYNAYWQWAGSYQLYNLYNQFTQIASKRLRLVTISYTNGDRAMMDTVEAYTQLQNYQLMQTESLQRYVNAQLELSNYLWLSNDSSLLLPDNYVPDSLLFSEMLTYKNAEELVSLSIAQNPSLRMYDFKLSTLEVQRRLKFQSLLPYVAVKANLLNRDYNVLKNAGTTFYENNYKWGLDVKIPIFLREARGQYRFTKLKIKETGLEFENKRVQTNNKIRSYFNDYTMVYQQWQTLRNMSANYQALLRNEDLKFSQGESSLFLVNTRETKVLEILQKEVELKLKFYKARYAVEWAAGLLR
jgi:outer membrane protein TolC